MRARRVKVSKRARQDVAAAAEWWKENRPAAPGAITEEVTRALKSLEKRADVAQKVRSSGYRDLRRMLLKRISYYLYFEIDHTDGSVRVVALWHASRSKPRV